MENTVQSKQIVMELFEDTRREFLENCRWIARRIAKENGGRVTIDDVREQVTTPENVDPRVYGAVFNTDEWEKVGYTNTTRQSSHGRPIAIFRFKGFKPNRKGGVAGYTPLFLLG